MYSWLFINVNALKYFHHSFAHKGSNMTTNIVFTDSRVTNVQGVIDSQTQLAEVFILDSQSDGLAQMVALLQGRTDVDALHIISHGSEGALYLGSTVLDGGNLLTYRSQLARIGSALTDTGDILVYGCQVAQGDVGLQFITSLAQYCGRQREYVGIWPV